MLAHAVLRVGAHRITFWTRLTAIATTVQVFPFALLSLMTIVLALAVSYLSGLLYGRQEADRE